MTPAADIESVAGADLIVLAAPVQQNLALLHQVLPHAVAGAVITDVGSTKRAIVGAAESIGEPVTFVGGHPLGGGARGGFEFATSGIFSRRPWIFTPSQTTPANATSRLFAFARGLGAVPSTMPAADHDRLLAFLSHLPQLSVSALMQVVGSAAGEKGSDARRPGSHRQHATRLQPRQRVARRLRHQCGRHRSRP